jgi:hypothetical protein
MTRHNRWLIAGLFVFAVMRGRAGEPAANAEAPGKLTLKTQRVVVFKDGYGLFVKTAEGTADKDGRVFTDVVPDGAILGSFWAMSDKNKILAMRAEWDERKQETSAQTACVTTVELLRANKGKAVKLGLNSAPNASVSGKLGDVLELPPPKPRDPAGAASTFNRGTAIDFDMNAAYRPALPHVSSPVSGGLLVVIETEDQGRLALPASDVRTVSGPELITIMTRREEISSRKKALSFDMGKESAGKKVSLNLVYFSEGIRWLPTYRISGELADKAELSLQGEIINEAEDISDTGLDLVVGVPNFRFKNTISPLSLEATLRNALSNVAPNLMNRQQQMSNAIFTQSGGVWQGRQPVEPDPFAAANVGLQNDVAASGQQDLFVYASTISSLKKGARATVPLWQSTSPLRHIHTMDVKFTRDSHSGSTFAGNPGGSLISPLKLAQYSVWHQFELQNNSNVPWTTGAALILKGMLPLGQELLTYTPPKGVALLPVTVAVDISGGYQEEELSRRANALEWNGNKYSLVRKQATIHLKNFRKEKSTLVVTTSLGGKVEAVSDDGKFKINDHRSEDWTNGSHAINNHSDVMWELELEAGQSKSLTFEFSFHVY